MSNPKHFICPMCLADDHTLKVSMGCYPKAENGGSLKISVIGECSICGTKWLHETTVKPGVTK